jgi:epoxyqueuosine reductase
MSLTTRLHERAVDLGVDRTGVCTAERFDEVAVALRRRVETGMHGGLGFTFADPERSTDVRRSFPWAERLFVAGRAYLPEAGSPGPPAAGTVRVARFATTDHYGPLRACLEEIGRELEYAGFRAAVLVDDHRLVDRAAAVRAGVGWWGKNTMVLAPAVGPWMLLGSVVTDAPLELSRPMERDCGTCVACLPACPTGALVAPGVLDARRCLAAVLQQPGSIPIELRAAVGDRLYGCDDCLDACPPGSKLLDRTTGTGGRHRALELLALDDRSLLDRFAHFYVPKRRPSLLRRNALVVLGNSGDENDVGLISGYLGNRRPELRIAAAWALGRIGGSMARAALDAASKSERDPAVRSELDAASQATRSR